MTVRLDYCSKIKYCPILESCQSLILFLNMLIALSLYRQAFKREFPEVLWEWMAGRSIKAQVSPSAQGKAAQ